MPVLNFKNACDYIKNTSSEEIFKRVVIYIVWADYKYQKRYGHDVLATLVSALMGPFDGFKDDPYEKEPIKDLMIITDWGWNQNWGNDITNWTKVYCASANDLNYFNQIGSILAQGKGDEICAFLNENAQNPPLETFYFYEINPSPWARLGNHWPRV